MAERTVTIPCGFCCGTGRIRHRQMTEMLSAVDRKFWFSTHDLAIFMAISGEHAANLLAKLHKLGHVERRGSRGPKGYEWRLARKRGGDG